MNNVLIRICGNINAYANGCFIWLFHRCFQVKKETTWKQPFKMVVSPYVSTPSELTNIYNCLIFATDCLSYFSFLPVLTSFCAFEYPKQQNIRTTFQTLHVPFDAINTSYLHLQYARLLGPQLYCLLLD